jgi:cell division protease FtsH
MVTQLGFSDKLGTVAYAEPQQEQFLGYSASRPPALSEATQQLIDAEVRRYVQDAYDTATRILTEKRDQLEILAKGLLEFETLSGDEMKGLLEGKRPVREDTSTTPQPPRGSAVPATGSNPAPDVGGMEPNPV